MFKQNNDEKSRLYGLPAEIIVAEGSTQHISIETNEIDIDIDVKNSQDTETSDTNTSK